MISVTFYKGHRLVLGVKTHKGILDVEAAASKFPFINNVPITSFDLITQGDSSKQALLRLIEVSNMDDSLFLKEDSLNFGPCVLEPQKIICIGLNYKKHALECKMPFPA